MDWRAPRLGLDVLAVASLTFIVVSISTDMGMLSIVGCTLMLLGFVAAAHGQRVPWLDMGGAVVVAIGGALFLVENYVPFAFGPSSIAMIAFILAALTLAY